jgi:hypothetical protein
VSRSATPRRAQAPRKRLRNVDCLHCCVVDLVVLWVTSGRDEGQEAVMRVGEAIGTLIAGLDPESRHAARESIAQVIFEVSEPVVGHA